MRFRRMTTMTVVVAVASLLGAACSSGSNTTSVDAVETADYVAMPTTSIAARRTTTTTTTSAPPTTLPPTQKLDATLASIIAQIAADPQLAATLGALQNADLAAMFNVELDLMELLGIDAAAIQGLGAVLMGATPEVLAGLAGGAAAGTPAPGTAPVTTVPPAAAEIAALQQLLELVKQINVNAVATIDGLNQEIVRALAAIIDSVDAEWLKSLTDLLEALDPNGLGQLSAEPDVASVVAVLAASLLRGEPTLGAAIRADHATEAGIIAVLDHLEQLGATIDPAIATAVTAIGAGLNPAQLDALAQLLGVLANPTTRDLLQGLQPG